MREHLKSQNRDLFRRLFLLITIVVVGNLPYTLYIIYIYLYMFSFVFEYSFNIIVGFVLQMSHVEGNQTSTDVRMEYLANNLEP